MSLLNIVAIDVPPNPFMKRNKMEITTTTNEWPINKYHVNYSTAKRIVFKNYIYID